MSQTFLKLTQTSSAFNVHESHQSFLTLHYRKSINVEKDVPLETDTGYLTVTDLNPVDEESYK